MQHAESEERAGTAQDDVARVGPSRRAVLRGGGYGLLGLAASGLLTACNRGGEAETAGGGSGSDGDDSGGGAGGGSGSSGFGGGAASEGETYVMVAYVASNPFWLDLQQGASDAAEGLGASFRFTGPDAYDVEAQVSTINQEVAQSPAGLIVPASTAAAVTPAINAAVEAGIPVVTIDADAPDSQRLAFIGTDHFELGVILGQQLVERTGGQARVGVSTVPGQDNLDARIAGIEEVFSSNPGMEIVATVNNQGDDSQTASTAVQMLQSDPDINAIAVVNATTAGIATALRETDRTGDVTVVGSDITQPVIDAIDDGSIAATMVQRTYMQAYLAVTLLFLNNHPTEYLQVQKDAQIELLPPRVNTGTIVVTEENVDAYKTLISQ